MQTVLIVGAGKSSSFLIDYMLRNARNQWKVIVADSNLDAINEKLNGHAKGEAVVLDIFDDVKRQSLVEQADIVLSVMPPALHNIVAKDCIKFKKNLITSSYVSDEIKAMDAAAKEAGVLFMCEMGLDPGIDHMSASDLIQGVAKVAGDIVSFKSYCGGLVAPESDDNPWQYKISWNPRNIVLAGSAGAEWLEEGKECKATYEELYESYKKIKVSNNHLGSLSYYPNRDSIHYLNLYHLPFVKTFMRATLRYPSFMKGWNIIIRAGLTDTKDKYDTTRKTFTDWVAFKTGLSNDEYFKNNFTEKYQLDDKTLKQVSWLGIFDNKRINLEGLQSSADILQTVLEEKWKMKATDKDMVVMQHELEYERKGSKTKIISSMVVIGETKLYSAMAKTVGLPMAILAAKILREGGIKNLTGVHIPVMPEVYVPVLKELKKHHVEFIEEII